MTEPNGSPVDGAVDELMREHAPRSFGPGFADRVMARVAVELAPRYEELVFARFRWLAAAAAVGALLLGGWSLLGDRPWDDQNTIEALFGLEPVTVESVFGVGRVETLEIPESRS